MRMDATFVSGAGPIWEDNGRWSRTNLGVKMYLEWICRYLPSEMTQRIACCQTLLSLHHFVSFPDSLHLPIALFGPACNHPLRTVLPPCQPDVSSSDCGSFISLWQTLFQQFEKKHRIYSQPSSGTRGKTLTWSTSCLKCVPLHWLNSTHNS